MSKREELFQNILRTVDSLPPTLRQVFCLSHYGGHSTHTISERLDRSEKEIDILLSEANAVFFSRLRKGDGSGKRIEKTAA